LFRVAWLRAGYEPKPANVLASDRALERKLPPERLILR
jgi:hypothetical protein